MGDQRQYWVTAHWPREVGKTKPHENIYVSKENYFVVKPVQVGDIVFIYETEKGRQKVGGNPRQHGKKSITTIAKVNQQARKNAGHTYKYTDGSTYDRSVLVSAPMLCDNGRIPRADLNAILEYELNYTLRGFGTNHSGVLEIDGSQAQSLFDMFCNNHIDQIRCNECPYNDKNNDKKVGAI